MATIKNCRHLTHLVFSTMKWYSVIMATKTSRTKKATAPKRKPSPPDPEPGKGGSAYLDDITIATITTLYQNTLISLREMSKLLDVSVNTIRNYTHGIERKAQPLAGVGRAIELMLSAYIPPPVACSLAGVELGTVLLALHTASENSNKFVIEQAQKAAAEGIQIEI
jgi:hypothetical protein